MTFAYLDGFTQPDSEVKFSQKRSIGGAAVGILIAEIWRPIFPGNVANASTFNFPVLYKIMQETSVEKILSGDPALLDICIDCGRELITQGARAIVGAIGYFANYQKNVAAALEVPVFLSSVLQIPMILQSLKPDQKVGIVCAHEGSLTPELLEQCNITESSQLVSIGTENLPEFKKILDCTGTFNSAVLEKQVVKLVRQFVADHPEVKAILLECGEMPAYSWAIQNSVNLPVFDYFTLINWVQQAVVRQPIGGFI
jgi:hypothetical protein